MSIKKEADTGRQKWKKSVSFWMSLVVFILGILIFAAADTDVVANIVGVLITIFGGFWLYFSLEVIPPRE